ncbi:MAG: fatty acyl-AMP ligase [Rubrivivax sp.]|jgi:acyl-CoA synthetase (AMP-forming)/AMP-acid ligase II
MTDTHKIQKPDFPQCDFKSYVDVLTHHAQHRGSALALTELSNLKDEGRCYTFADLDRRCRAIAALLQARGAVGERAALAFDNDADYLTSFIACAYAGVIAVPLFAPVQRHMIERFKSITADCDARFVLTTHAAYERLQRVESSESALARLEAVCVDTVNDTQADRWEPTAPHLHDLAYLQYTSGSTGAPRGVMVTHENLIYQGRYIQSACNLQTHDRALSWLPLYHDMGLIVGGLQPLFSGFPLWLATPHAVVMHPERWLRTISRLRITHAGAPNFIYDLCCDSVDRERLGDADLSCWRVAYNSAEPIRSSSIERFTRTLAPLGLPPTAPHPAYGLAEATLAVTLKRRDARPVITVVDAAQLSKGLVQAPSPGLASRSLVSSGTTDLETRVVIVDINTLEQCPVGVIGEVWVSGPTVTKGYWHKPAETRETFGARTRDGQGPYLRTGDLGLMDAAGELFITGRLKDLIIVSGKNHYPQDIEETVEASSPEIRPHAVAALSVEGAAGEAVVVLAEVHRRRSANFDAPATAQAIRRRVSQEHQVPVAEVILLERGQLPMTTSGKIQRRASRELLMADAFQIVGRFVN